MMRPKVLHLLPSSLSARLSLWVILFVAILFMATFSLMFYYARQAVRAEAMGMAEDMLEKLEVSVLNTLHKKEVVARQTYWYVQHNIKNPSEIEHYIPEILKHQPEIIGVAAAFVPGYYPDKPGEYMIYYYRKGSKLIKSEQFAGESYLYQPWYSETLKTEKEYWSAPQENYRTNNEPIISFGIPLRDNGKVVGVFAIDISLYWLSETIEGMRSSQTNIAGVATRKGAFIVHPDTTMLKPGSVFKIMEQYPGDKYSMFAYKMLGGETGSTTLKFGNTMCFVAYKPLEGTPWVIDVVCPEEEVMGHYNHLVPLMVIIVILAVLMIVAFFYFFIHRELKPLRVLEASVKQMTKGDYYAPVTTSDRKDEVGDLTNSFVAMRRSIRGFIDKINHNRERLEEQNKALNEANEHIKEADRVKTAFLQNMTDQMNEPLFEISNIVAEVKDHIGDLSHERIGELSNMMAVDTDIVTTLLTRVLEVATKKEEKEEEEESV